MAVLSRPELKKLENILVSELEGAIEERKNLGLSVPDNYLFGADYQSSPNSLAYAQKTSDNILLRFNLLNSVIGYLGSEDRNRVDWIINYFDRARTILGDENYILYSLDNPKKALELHESNFSQDQLNIFKKSISANGNSYDNQCLWIINNSKDVRDTLEYVMPKIDFVLESMDYNLLRHELDHVDFFSSSLYMEYLQVIKDRVDSKKAFDVTPSIATSDAYLKATMRDLEYYSQIPALLEVRAFYLTYVNPGQWNQVDMAEISNKVYNIINLGYIENTYMPRILDALIAQSWNKGEMDKETSNALFYTIHTRRRSADVAGYMFDENKINLPLGKKILDELEKWQDIFRENTRKACDVIGKAYQYAPHKLSEANNAKTFDEYLKLCEI